MIAGIAVAIAGVVLVIALFRIDAASPRSTCWICDAEIVPEDRGICDACHQDSVGW